MPSNEVLNPYGFFTDTDGTALDAGFIYIGTANTDPQSNPIAVFLDQAMTIPAAQPIRTLSGYPAQNGTPAKIFTNTDYSIMVKNKKGLLVFSSPSENSGLLNDFSNTTDPLLGDALVGVKLVATDSIARTQHSKNADTINVADFGPGNTPDDTSVVQAAMLAAKGGTLEFTNGVTYTISAGLLAYTGSTYLGNGCRIVVKGGVDLGYNNGIFYGPGDDILITGFELDGNKGNGSKAFGVKLTGGSRNVVTRNYIHDTYYSGIWWEGQVGFGILGNVLDANGVVGISDNHSIQIVSLGAGAPTKEGSVAHNRVTGAQRKGITTYQANGGAISGVSITQNAVSGCLLGGLYIGTLAASGVQSGMVISQNTVGNCYTNIELVNLRSFSVEGNTCTGSTDRSGITASDLEDGVITGNSISDSATRGILLTIGDGAGNKNVAVTCNTIMRSNRSGDGFSGGIDFDNTTYCLFEGNLVSDTAVAPKQVRAIAEGANSDFNIIRGNLLANASSALSLTTGSNTFLETTTGKIETLTELVVNVPRSPQVALAMVNGVNSDVALPVTGSNLYVTGPTADFSITGLVPPTSPAGRKITILNYTAFVMTISHDVVSATGNRIFIGGSLDITFAQYGCVELTYFPIASAWFVTGGSRA